MKRQLGRCAIGSLAAAIASAANAGTDIFFNPLTQSAVVSAPDSLPERNSPWLAPPGISQINLTSLSEVEADINQSIVVVPGAESSSSMIDMSSYSPNGRYVFLPHETPWGAGASRYDTKNDIVEIIFQGDGSGVSGDWNGDYGAFDPSTWTTHDTLFLAEEWTAEGRIIEILNPLAPAGQIQYRELESIANVAHEGLQFSSDEKTLYFIDEWNSGAFYKFVMKNKASYDVGQTFVLKVDAYAGDASQNYNHPSNSGQPRTGLATWVPITDKFGNALTNADPFLNGPTADPNTNPATRGGRTAADELGATPYGRPEDMEIGRLRNGREVIYVAVTSENAVYAIEELGNGKAKIWVAASGSTPKNLGFAQTSGALNSPDNLAQDALGNIYIIEDAPNGSPTGGDIWFMRDVDSDGVAESLDHFMSVQVSGSEATGMIFNPAKPTEFIVSVMHPDTAFAGTLDDPSLPPTETVTGFGDALWQFDLSGVVPPPCERTSRYYRSNSTCTNTGDFHFVKMLERAGSRRWWNWW